MLSYLSKIIFSIWTNYIISNVQWKNHNLQFHFWGCTCKRKDQCGVQDDCRFQLFVFPFICSDYFAHFCTLAFSFGQLLFFQYTADIPKSQSRKLSWCYCIRFSCRRTTFLTLTNDLTEYRTFKLIAMTVSCNGDCWNP